MRTIAILVAATMLSAGCVSKKKYNELETMYEEAQTQNKKLRDQLEARDRKAKQRLEAFRELMKDFKPLIDRGVLKIEVVEGRVVIGMASDVLFASGSAELSADGKSNVAEVARLLGKRSDRNFQVEGHTDNVPISSEMYPSNWELGAARAVTVMKHMVSNGMPQDQISAATFGDQMPVASNGTDEGRAQNRRIEIVLLPDVSEIPGYEMLMQEGKGGVKRGPKGKPRKPPKGKRPPPR